MSIFTLSGWTQPADAVSRALGLDTATFDYSDYSSAEASFEGLKKFADAEHIIGWSLGGQLALRAIAAGVLKPKRLTLIAAPFQFLRSDAMTQAMDPLTYHTFRQNYATDPVRTSGRFHALVAKGDRAFREVLGRLNHHPEVENTNRWLPWFDELGAASLAGLSPIAIPTVIVHGMEDTIVPVAQAQKLQAVLPNARVERWEGVAHAPHLHDAARLRSLLEAA